MRKPIIRSTEAGRYSPVKNLSFQEGIYENRAISFEKKCDKRVRYGLIFNVLRSMKSLSSTFQFY